jgi:hypothetical protein
MLKRLDGGAGAVAVIAVGINGAARAQNGAQAALDVGDRGTRVPEGDRKAYRYAEISCSS